MFLNLSDDHLDRHNGRGGYFAAKRRLIEDSSVAVIGIDGPEGQLLASIHHTPISFVTNDAPDLLAAKTLRGAHNAQNAAAAQAVLRHLGMDDAEIVKRFNSFGGLPHRLEYVTEINGITYVNDSKATNADAAEKALRSYDNIRWIAGGVPKEGGVETLLPLMPRVKKSYLIGESATEFSKTLGDHPHQISSDLKSAILQATQEAEKGDVILLAPACASFDQFTSFEARGDTFKAIVSELPQK